MGLLNRAVHEAAHILGMSSNAFRYFYDSETGKPRTSRPFQTESVTCVDGVERTLGLPAGNTVSNDLQFIAHD